VNLGALVAGLMDADGLGGLVVSVRYFAFGEDVPPSQAARGVRVIDMTGRKGIDRDGVAAPIDPQELDAMTAAANAATVRGQLDAMQAAAPEPEEPAAPTRGLNVYDFAEMMIKRESRAVGRQAITTSPDRILGD
jgi:hypothetical protein